MATADDRSEWLERELRWLESKREQKLWSWPRRTLDQVEADLYNVEVEFDRLLEWVPPEDSINDDSQPSMRAAWTNWLQSKEDLEAARARLNEELDEVERCVELRTWMPPTVLTLEAARQETGKFALTCTNLAGNKLAVLNIDLESQHLAAVRQHLASEVRLPPEKLYFVLANGMVTTESDDELLLHDLLCPQDGC